MQNSTKNNVISFLDDICSNNMLSDSISSLNQNFNDNFSNFTSLHRSRGKILKMIECCNNQQLENKLDEYEIMVFNISHTSNIIRSTIEQTNKLLQSCINDKFLKPNMPIGVLLTTICDNLKYDKEKQKEIKKLFHIELRNLLSHENNIITHNAMRCNINSKNVEYSMKKLECILNQTLIIYKTIHVYYTNYLCKNNSN